MLSYDAGCRYHYCGKLSIMSHIDVIDKYNRLVCNCCMSVFFAIMYRALATCSTFPADAHNTIRTSQTLLNCGTTNASVTVN